MSCAESRFASSSATTHSLEYPAVRSRPSWKEEVGRAAKTRTSVDVSSPNFIRGRLQKAVRNDTFSMPSPTLQRRDFVWQLFFSTYISGLSSGAHFTVLVFTRSLFVATLWVTDKCSDSKRLFQPKMEALLSTDSPDYRKRTCVNWEEKLKQDQWSKISNLSQGLIVDRAHLSNTSARDSIVLTKSPSIAKLAWTSTPQSDIFSLGTFQEEYKHLCTKMRKERRVSVMYESPLQCEPRTRSINFILRK